LESETLAIYSAGKSLHTFGCCLIDFNVLDRTFKYRKCEVWLKTPYFYMISGTDVGFPESFLEYNLLCGTSYI